MTADLIKALEEAEEGSRELSDEVLVALGWRLVDEPTAGYFGLIYWETPEGDMAHLRPSPTESVDDAMALVPAGYDEEIKRARHRRGWHVALWRPERIGHIADAATPALALCAAVLRATPTTLGEDEK